MSVELHNRVCLITGGANGIGRATAVALLKAGARVCVADVSADAIEAFTRTCDSKLRSQLDCCRVDVSLRSDVEAWVANVHQQHGRIDVLVHCAATVDWNRVEDQSVEAIERSMRVGFDGMVYGTKAVLPVMRANAFGRIVYISSVVSTMHLFPGYAAYAALKAATDAWATMMQIEMKGTPIQIANVRPGVVIDTNFYRHAVDRIHLPRLFDFLPAATPDRLAATVVRAIGKSNRTYVTPAIYRILDGTCQLFPRLSRWLCTLGTSRRTDITTRDDQPA